MSFSSVSSNAVAGHGPATRQQLIESMQRVWKPGSGVPHASRVQHVLRELNAVLLEMTAGGVSAHDPLEPARKRTLPLPTSVMSEFEGARVLITGGEGCVGRRLAEVLLEHGAQVATVDNARSTGRGEYTMQHQGRVKAYAVDVRDRPLLDQIFLLERPRFVFHLAAQRHPGLAETDMIETLSTGVSGTRYLLELSAEYGVERFVFASTGKASRYTTSEIYCASKKMGEWLVGSFAQRHRMHCGIARFTHILDNSIVSADFDRKIAAGGPVSTHAANRFLVVQTCEEAVGLLLQSFAEAIPYRTRLLCVRNLGWPVDTFDVLLWKIRQTGQPRPVYFTGLPPGYEEAMFPGQFSSTDWRDPNQLLNALETRSKQLAAEGQALAVLLPQIAPAELESAINRVEMTVFDELPNHEIKLAVGEACDRLALASFRAAGRPVLHDILDRAGDCKHPYHQRIVDLIEQALTVNELPRVGQIEDATTAAMA